MRATQVPRGEAKKVFTAVILAKTREWISQSPCNTSCQGAFPGTSVKGKGLWEKEQLRVRPNCVQFLAALKL